MPGWSFAAKLGKTLIGRSSICYHVEQSTPLGWLGLGWFPALELAIRCAKDAGGETRITEYPAAKVVWERNA